jgi:hypothetical protein
MSWKITGIVSLILAAIVINCDGPFSSSDDDDGDNPGVIIADQYEPDDMQSVAKTISTDGVSQSRTLKKGDTDWISFSATSGKSYKIYTTGNTDTRIKVYSSSSLLIEGDDSPNNFNASVVVNCTSPTTYAICVSGNDATVSGSYEIHVVSSIGLDSYESDSTPKTARFISNTSQNHTLSENDVDWVYFSGNSGDSILITGNGTCRMSLSLYDIDTVTILQSSPKSDSVALLRYRLSTTGYYFVKISAQSSSVTGTYRITYLNSSNGSIVLDDIYESDDTKATAKLLPGVSTIQSRTLPYSDTDWVMLPVANGKQYVITISNSSITGTMFTKTGAILSGPSYSLSLNSSDNDTVYIRIASTSTSNLSYTLTLSTLLQPTMIDEYENDNTKELAKIKCLSIDTFIQDRTLSYLNSILDTDWVAFPVLGGKQYTFKITTVSTSSSYLYMYLYNKTSTSYINNLSTSSSSYFSYTPSNSDTMYLMIRTSSYSAAAYSLSVQGKYSNDTYEPDSVRSLASSLSSSLQSRILLPRDTDWVMYTSIAGDSMVVSTTGLTDTKLALFTSSGSSPILENDNISATDKNAQVSWKAPLGGTFYICISGSTPAISGPYAIKFASVSLGTIVASDTFENDNSKAIAQLVKDSILTNQTHSLTLGDTDWIAFPVVTGARYTYSATNSNSGYLNMYLYSSKDSLITSYTSSYNPSVTYASAKNDTVFLRITTTVTSAVAQYKVSMTVQPPSPPDAYEDDNTKAKAQLIKDTLLSSQMHSLIAYDTDWVALPVISGGRYTVTISNSTSYSMNMYCYTSKDSLIVSRTSYTNPSYTYAATKDDTIYFKYCAYSSPIATYYISMSRVLPPAPDAFEIDNTKATARFVSTAISNEVHTLPLNDTDWVAFKIAKGGQYSLTVNNNTSGYYMSMYLYTSKDSLITSRTSYTSPSISYTPMKDDTVYCKIVQTGSPIPLYALTISATLPPDPDIYEFDNSRTAAKPILLDSVQSRTLAYTDTDWVKVAVDSGFTYTVSAPGTFTHYLYLYYSTSTSYTTYNSGSSVSCTLTPTIRDTIFIMVRYYSTGSSYMGPYTLSVTRKSVVLSAPPLINAPVGTLGKKED